MAGTDVGFSAAEFREAIHFAMTMGAPPDTENQVVFSWAPTRTYDAANPSDAPYDWTDAPLTSTSPAPVTLTAVAVEFSPVADGTGTPMGRFDQSKGMLTILDEDYVAVATADRVSFGGRTYMLQEATPIGLFEVTVWQIPITEGDARR